MCSTLGGAISEILSVEAVGATVRVSRSGVTGYPVCARLLHVPDSISQYYI